MGVLRNSFFSLPIHRRRKEKYYEDNEKEYTPEKQELEKTYGKPFEEFDNNMQARYMSVWQWPIWRYNDIVGYLEIGMDGYNHLTADIFLKRKYFPRNSWIRQGSYKTTLQNHQLFYYSEIDKTKVDDLSDNNSYLSALNRIIENAEAEIKKRNKGFVLWMPDYGFECIDFVKAFKQLKEKEV